MTPHEKIIIIDLGSQYTQLIARRIRSLHVYCEIVTTTASVDKHARGVILSGSPCSVHDKSAPMPNITPYVQKKVPVLGICYGAQWIAQQAGGSVLPSKQREYGAATLHLTAHRSALLDGIEPSQVWMSHSDSITALPSHFEDTAHTHGIPYAAFQCAQKGLYGLQFHPEVVQTTMGTKILKNYVLKICDCTANWVPQQFLDEKIREIQQTIPHKAKVLMALSGGVDSSVAALLIHRAVPDCLHSVFVDHGFLRKKEYEEVLALCEQMGIKVTGINAKDTFYAALADVEDPEKKRKIIGNTFIEVFERYNKKSVQAAWMGQGTIYPDVIESVATKGPSHIIKSHHNVGGLPKNMSMRLVEPLRELFKDEVREVGKCLGLPTGILQRHPFPGPGLAIRIIGAVTRKKVDILREADDIFVRALKKHGEYDKVWQAGALLLPVRSTGVMGDARTYEAVVTLRAVCSTDGMTATWAALPHELLATISSSIVNKIEGVNRVTYDITSKPPGTIEWE